MNLKVGVIILVALVAAAVLVLFYGALRPSGDVDGAHGGVEGGLGWLVPSRTLSFDDVRDADCAHAENANLRVAAGTRCTAPLPNPAEIYLCSDETFGLTVLTRGDDYPEQKVDADHLSCADPVAIPIYDTGTLLIVGCAGFQDCAVRVLTPPEG